jgi:hypothetical protein
MSGDNSSPADSFNEMMRHWFEMAAQTAESCGKWPDRPITPESLRQSRSNVIKIWSDYWEHLLRSSAFLDAEKQCMAGNLEFRKQVHEFLAQFHHEMQLATAQDIDQIMRTMRRIEEDRQEQSDQILLTLGKVSAQMDAIAGRLDALEKCDSPAVPSSSDRRNRRKQKPNRGNTSKKH